MDWCYHPSLRTMMKFHSDQHLTLSNFSSQALITVKFQRVAPQQVYGEMEAALNKTGRHIFFALVRFFHPIIISSVNGVKVILGWYLWTSTGLLVQWANPIGNSWRVGPDHLPFWWLPDDDQGTGDIIEMMAGKSPYAGPGGWNDPDFLMTYDLTILYRSAKIYTLTISRWIDFLKAIHSSLKNGLL